MAVDHNVATNIRRGELAARMGCNLETVRYYEKIELLPEPPRRANGYRGLWRKPCSASALHPEGAGTWIRYWGDQSVAGAR